MNIVIGALISTITAAVAVKKSKLTFNAGCAAVVIGTLTYFFGGWQIGVLLILFFISASATSRFKKRVDFKSASKARRVSQVLANGIPAVLFALVYYFTDNQMFSLAAVSAIAGATADTWSSDIGVISRRKTISILTLKPITAGQSGGISLLGCISSVLGSVFIAGIGITLFCFTGIKINNPLASFFIIVLCGITGSLADSVMGAGIQAKYRYKGKVIEDKENNTKDLELISGFSFINNDIVNLLSGFIAGGISVIFFL